tara:strand:+ start:228 stop:611 length:384 start_codon:yes stop_codon:yes gene_type:complete
LDGSNKAYRCFRIDFGVIRWINVDLVKYIPPSDSRQQQLRSLARLHWCELFRREIDGVHSTPPAFPFRVLYGFQPLRDGIRLPDVVHQLSGDPRSAAVKSASDGGIKKESPLTAATATKVEVCMCLM